MTDYIEPEYVAVEQKSSSFFPTTAENWTLWLSSISLTILFIIGAYFGSRQPFYQNIKVRNHENVYVIAGIWILVSLISYLSFYFVRNYDECIYGQSRLLPLFLIISFLNILWLVTFYIYGSYMYTLIILFTIILVNFYTLIFLYYINIWAAVASVPLFAMYIYLFYSILHLASANQIII